MVNSMFISLYRLRCVGQLLLAQLVSTSRVSFVSSEYLTNTLSEGEQIGHVNDLQDYISIKVKNWRTFEQSDITRNQIRSAEELMKIPGFVKLFEQKLIRKPRLHPDVRFFFDLSVCGSILTAQCRCMLYCRYTTFLDHILSFPRTRSPEMNLLKKRAMSSDWSCCISHPLRFTIGKRVGNRCGVIIDP